MLSCFIAHDANLTSSSEHETTEHVPDIKLDPNIFLLTWDSFLVHTHMRMCVMEWISRNKASIICSASVVGLLPTLTQRQHDTISRWDTMTGCHGCASPLFCSNILRLSPCSLGSNLQGSARGRSVTRSHAGWNTRKGQPSSNLVFLFI